MRTLIISAIFTTFLTSCTSNKEKKMEVENVPQKQSTIIETAPVIKTDKEVVDWKYCRLYTSQIAENVLKTYLPSAKKNDVFNNASTNLNFLYYILDAKDDELERLIENQRYSEFTLTLSKKESENAQKLVNLYMKEKAVSEYGEYWRTYTYLWQVDAWQNEENHDDETIERIAKKQNLTDFYQKYNQKFNAFRFKVYDIRTYSQKELEKMSEWKSLKTKILNSINKEKLRFMKKDSKLNNQYFFDEEFWGRDWRKWES